MSSSDGSYFWNNQNKLSSTTIYKERDLALFSALELEANDRDDSHWRFSEAMITFLVALLVT